MALELSAEARHNLGRVIDRLRRCEADVKWVARESLHLTLKFLGDVPAAGVPALTETLRAAVAGSSPFFFQPDGNWRVRVVGEPAGDLDRGHRGQGLPD